MADKTKIQLEVETKLTESLSDIKTLKNKGAINDKVETQIEGIIKQLESLGQISKPSLQQLSQINALFNQLTDILLKVAQSSKAASKEFKDLEKKLEAQTLGLDKARSEKGSILKKGRVNKDTGKYELFTTYQDEVVKQANIKNSKGNSIKTAETFYKKFDANGNPIEGAFQDPTAAKKLYDSLKKTQETNALRLEELNQVIVDYQEAIKKSQEALNAQAIKEGNALTAGIIGRKISVNETVQSEKDAIHAERDAQKNTSSPEDLAKVTNKETSALGKAFKQFTLYAVAVRAAKQALREAVQTVKELDKYLTEQAMVTGKTRKETYALVGQYQELALACGATTKEIAQVTTEYMKQGKSTADALVLTEAAVKAAKVARVSVGDSVNYLTTALNGFRLEAEDAMRVSDIFAAVAASSATDYDELAIALSKVASQANLAGMSIEYTTALLTKGLETTREAPETMGTALKTIIARMREMSDYGETLEGDTDINNVESQLAYVGIALKNEQGELRSTEEVLDELGQKWDQLNKNQQAALAKALAGTRQQSRLIAMMDDYERVIELQQIAERSAGATSAQAAVYLEGMEAAMNKIQVAWEKVIMTITDSEVIIGFFDLVGNVVNSLGELLENPFFTGTGLVAIVSTLTLILGKKLQEQHIARETVKLEREKSLIEGKQRLKTLEENKKIREDEIKKNAASLKQEVEKTYEIKKQGLEAKKAGLLKENAQADTSAIDAEIQKLETEKKQKLQEIDQQTQKNIEANNQYYNEQIKFQKEINLNLEGQTSLIANAGNAWLGYANTIKNVATSVVSIFKGIAKTMNDVRSGNMATSASVIPMIGWIISLVILGGSLLSTIIAAVMGVINMFAQWIGSLGDSAEKTSENINKLSNEIYKLNETANKINNVTSQFDKLDNKVIKTKEDIEEMNSLLDSAADALDEDDKKTYDNLQTNEAKRRFLEQKEAEKRAEANAKRQEQLREINSSKYKTTILDDNTTNSDYLETQSAIRAIANNEIYETIDALKEEGIYTDEQLKNTEDLTEAILAEVSAMEALHYANNPDELENLVNILNSLKSEDNEFLVNTFMDDSTSFSNRLKAYKEIEGALNEDTAALEAFNKAYSEWETFSNMSEDIIEFIEATDLSIDQINKLYEGYTALQKAGMEITKEEFQAALEDTMTLMEDDLSNFNQVVQSTYGYLLEGLDPFGEEYQEKWNAIVSAIGDVFAVGLLDMGQNMEKFGNTINSFYEKASEWGSMSESDKMAFISDNAELFSGAGGKELLQAFQSGNYDAIEAALATQMADQTAQRLEEVRRTLAVEEARVGEDRNEAYIQSLKDYEKYLMDGNDLYKASLELRLEQEKKQIDEYKSYLEDQQKALEDSLNKRKDAYEKYFESINQQSEDEDYEDQAALLTTNLSKLASSGNADAKNKTADLEQQLKELEKERLETLRERAQEAVVQNIEDQVEEINDKFDKLLNSNEALLAAMTGELNNPNEFLANLLSNKLGSGATTLEMQSYLEDLKAIYGSTLGTDVFDNIKVTENNGQTVLNINNQEVLLSEGEQQSVYAAIIAALRQIGKA